MAAFLYQALLHINMWRPPNIWTEQVNCTVFFKQPVKLFIFILKKCIFSPVFRSRLFWKTCTAMPRGARSWFDENYRVGHFFIRSTSVPWKKSLSASLLFSRTAGILLGLGCVTRKNHDSGNLNMNKPLILLNLPFFQPNFYWTLFFFFFFFSGIPQFARWNSQIQWFWIFGVCKPCFGICLFWYPSHGNEAPTA